MADVVEKHSLWGHTAWGCNPSSAIYKLTPRTSLLWTSVSPLVQWGHGEHLPVPQDCCASPTGHVCVGRLRTAEPHTSAHLLMLQYRALPSALPLSPCLVFLLLFPESWVKQTLWDHRVLELEDIFVNIGSVVLFKITWERHGSQKFKFLGSNPNVENQNLLLFKWKCV